MYSYILSGGNRLYFSSSILGLTKCRRFVFYNTPYLWDKKEKLNYNSRCTRKILNVLGLLTLKISISDEIPSRNWEKVRFRQGEKRFSVPQGEKSFLGMLTKRNKKKYDAGNCRMERLRDVAYYP